MYEKIGVIVNRVTDKSLLKLMDFGGVDVLAAIGDDKNLTMFDLTGENVFNLPENSEIVEGVKTALSAIGVLNK